MVITAINVRNADEAVAEFATFQPWCVAGGV